MDPVETSEARGIPRGVVHGDTGVHTTRASKHSLQRPGRAGSGRCRTPGWAPMTSAVDRDITGPPPPAGAPSLPNGRQRGTAHLSCRELVN